MAAPAKLLTMSVGFQHSDGTVIANGTLKLTLSQSITITATGGVVDITPKFLPLDVNGKITNTAEWFNDEGSPSGTVYYGTVYDSGGCAEVPGLEKLTFSFTGPGPYDLSTAVQSGPASPSYSGAVLLTPTGNQTITTGNLTLTTGSLVETANAVTGTGGLVRKTSPTLTTPTLGVATATTINGVTIPTATDTAALLAAVQTLTGKTYDTAGSGNVFKINGTQITAVTGTGSAVLASSPAIASPTINTGVTQGSGVKHQRFGASCSTAAAVNASCTTTYSWTSAFADANYTVVCVGDTNTNIPILESETHIAASVTVTIIANSAAAASFGAVNCIAIHD